MKVSKLTVLITGIVFLIIVSLVGYLGYVFGQHNASLTIKPITPKQIAEAMQADDFYGMYPKTMLLVTGTVKGVTRLGSDTIVQFAVTNPPTALGNVSCDFKNNQTRFTTGQTIRVLTVAYDAERRNAADVLLNNCYLL